MRVQDIAIQAALSIPILIGLGLAGLGSRNLWYALSSPGWPRVLGKVMESATSPEASRDSRTGAEAVMYSAAIVFGYRVGQRDYTTETIHFGQTAGSGDSSDAELRLLRYPPGADVSVSHHPKDPSIAAVRPGFHSDALWLPGAGLGFLLPGVMFLILYRTGMGGGGLWTGLSLFATIFMLIGAALLSGGLLNLWRAFHSRSWPRAQGTILYGQRDSSATVSEDEDGNIERSTTYGAHFVYRFEVNGAKHFSNNRRFGQLAGASAEWAAEIAERYPLGKRVEVAYSPDDPDLAVLEPGIHSEAYWLPGAGAAFLLFGAAAAIWGIPALAGRGR